MKCNCIDPIPSSLPSLMKSARHLIRLFTNHNIPHFQGPTPAGPPVGYHYPISGLDIKDNFDNYPGPRVSSRAAAALDGAPLSRIEHIQARGNLLRLDHIHRVRPCVDNNKSQLFEQHSAQLRILLRAHTRAAKEGWAPSPCALLVTYPTTHQLDTFLMWKSFDRSPLLS